MHGIRKCELSLFGKQLRERSGPSLRGVGAANGFGLLVAPMEPGDSTLQTTLPLGESPLGRRSADPSNDKEGSQIVVGCPGELGTLLRHLASRFGARVTVCQGTLQAVAEACAPSSVLVMITHQPAETDWAHGWFPGPDGAGSAPPTISTPRAHAPPLCHILRGLQCAARVVCLDAANQVDGTQQCAADVQIEAPRSPAGLVRILGEIRAATAPRTTLVSRSRRILAIGDLAIDIDSRRVLVKNLPLSLTKSQYELLVAFVENEGRVITFDELHRIGCNLSPWTGDTRAVRQQVSKLAHKVEHHSLSIENIRGVGYALKWKANTE